MLTSRRKRVLAAVCVLTVLAACRVEPPGPAETMRLWFEAVARLDLASVRALTCARDNQSVDNALSLSGEGLSYEVDLSNLQAQITVDLAGLNFVGQRTDADAAVVRVFGTLNGQPIDQEVWLAREDDAWKVCPSVALDR
jgi:hypothetical protein